jgi:hypothetical protein
MASDGEKFATCGTDDDIDLIAIEAPNGEMGIEVSTYSHTTHLRTRACVIKLRDALQQFLDDTGG